uniref:Uncharacterized protein n=1 Tax=Steinernema glaseri TaxID=37863 RepID=A0A1I7YLE3_9BILA
MFFNTLILGPGRRSVQRFYLLGWTRNPKHRKQPSVCMSDGSRLERVVPGGDLWARYGSNILEESPDTGGRSSARDEDEPLRVMSLGVKLLRSLVTLIYQDLLDLLDICPLKGPRTTLERHRFQ